MRIPGCSKIGSIVRLLPADASDLTEDIGSLLVGNSPIREVHITTQMVVDALEQHFNCTDLHNCALKSDTVDIPDEEIDYITKQIRTMYTNKTGKDNDSLKYSHGNLWNVGHSERCIHGEEHRSNRMYIIVKKRSVYCQCNGRCQSEYEAVFLGNLHTILSTSKYPWQQMPISCYQGILAIDIISRLPKDIPPLHLAMHLACVGDNKALLDKYAGYDTIAAWTSAIVALTHLDAIPTQSKTLKELEKFIDYHVNPHGKNKKRKLCPTIEPFTFKFDFVRFEREHPHPLSINHHSVSHQIVNSRFLEYSELDLSHRVNLVKSEMMTGKTSNLIVKELKALPLNARVCALTPRQLFADSIRGQFKREGLPFAHYHDENFFKDKPARIIIEVESLWMLRKYNFDAVDYLLIDESETTLAQMLCTTTHKHNMRNNWNVLIWLLENAKKVLLTDARLSMISMGFALDHCKKTDIHYIHNIFKLPMQVNYYLNKANIESKLEASILRLETLYTFSGGRNNAINLHNKTKEAFGSDKSVIYTSLNSCTKVVKDQLSNVNQEWKNMSAIHTSPSITIGTSFDVENVIQNIFMFPLTTTAGPKDVAQASRRIRNPISPILNICVSGFNRDVPTTLQKIKRLLDEKSNLLMRGEKTRTENDFTNDDEVLKAIRLQIKKPGEKSTLIKQEYVSS